MRKNKPSYWTYLQNQNDHFPDPRIRIAKQIGWQKFNGSETSFSLPEPDNYNRAVITDKLVECTFVENQVMYKVKDGWVCVMLVDEELSGEYSAWVERLKPVAYWQHTNPPVLRKHRLIPL
jgi:hypothetical protein